MTRVVPRCDGSVKDHAVGDFCGPGRLRFKKVQVWEKRNKAEAG